MKFHSISHKDKINSLFDYR